MTPRQKIFALMVCVALFGIIVSLVHKRKLKEEYAWLWLVTSAALFVLVLWYDLLVGLTNLIGAVLPTTTLFLFGLLFFMLITLHFSIKISRLSTMVTELAQETAILREENRALKSAPPEPEKEDEK